ncbi:MAG: 2-amino-4-hydroxy-6-hydroxymethyldihydropteridine diphosphokinase [Pseudomonadota bacterium]
MTRAYVGLGSNQGPSESLLQDAVSALDLLPHTSVSAVSPLYRTPPWGVTDQDDFLNAVVALDTALEAEDLLRALLTIERTAGRRRDGRRWGPRTLDLDLLVYGDSVIETEALHVPHPRMHQRAFVLVPLCDLAPDLAIPGLGRAADQLKALDSESRAEIKLAGSLEYYRAP